MTQPDMQTPKIHLTGRALLNMTPQQVHALYKLRVDIFVSEQRAPFAEIDDVDIHPNTQHILAYVHPGSGPDFPFGAPDPASPLRLVGTARIYGQPEEQHIGRLCVSSDMRGFAISRQIIDEALDVCRGRAAALDPSTQKALVKIEAQAHLTEFYRSYGFEPIGEEFDVDGIRHVEMHLQLD